MVAGRVGLRDVLVVAGLAAAGAAVAVVRQLTFHPERGVWPQAAQIAAALAGSVLVALAALWLERRRRPATRAARPAADDGRPPDPAVGEAGSRNSVLALGDEEALVSIKSCMPVIPSADLEKSLRFWVEGLGLSVDRAMRQDGRLVGCMVHDESLYFWLNQRAGTPVGPADYEGIRLYWAPPRDIHALRERLQRLGYTVSELADRDYGQTEFFVTDDDGHSHCFGVATERRD